MKIENKKILVLAPHTDDMEFGCGGTIAKLIEMGNEVYCATFSACEQSVLEQFPKDILITEIKKAVKELGMKQENLFLYQFQVRTFNFHRQEILEELIKLKASINPDIVFMPALDDLHQDHATIAQEGLRAFKMKTIFCYEMIWNNLSFNTSCFFSLSEAQLERKITALKQYESQAHRPYASEDFIRSLGSVRGVQIGVKYAECFEVLRLSL
ncbi:MAG: PIG-L deacetylase family protein [Flavobacteriales bacterium]